MNEKQRSALILHETDIDGALYRCCKNEQLYEKCLKLFIKDNTMNSLESALINNNWDDAFTAAHALKGLAGNLGFVPLMHAAGQLVVMIRGGRTDEAKSYFHEVNNCFIDILTAVEQFLSYE